MENKHYNIPQLKERISLSQFLTDLGFHPVKKSAGETFYHSMIREGDKTPSFCVNERMGLWFDHGLGKGGDLIDLAQAMWPEMNFSEVLRKIADLTMGAPFPQPNTIPVIIERIPEKTPWYRINQIADIGGNKALLDYLDFRRLRPIAKDYLKEIRYEVTMKDNKQQTFCAAGWPNEKGGWEIRNENFKGCLGKKGLSVFDGNPSKLSLFEGFLDFLSWKVDNVNSTDSVIVLNSVVNLKEVIVRAQGFSAVDVFFDNDIAGKKALSELIDSVPHARDRADDYQGYKDYNEKRMAENPRPWKAWSELLISELYKPVSGKR